MRRNLCTLLAAAVVSCMGGTVMAQSDVGNPGFESAVLYDQPAPPAGNWSAFFGGPPTSTLIGAVDATAPHTGAQAIHLSIFGDGNAFCGVQQPITGIQPGVSYTMKIWARKLGNINNGVEFRFEWKNAANGFIGDQFALTTRIDAALTDTYQQFTLTAVAPAGAANCNLVLAAQSFVFNPVTPTFDTSVLIDDVVFGATPLQTQTACCLADGSCQVAVAGSCPAGATPQAAGTTCAVNNCPPPAVPGACCNTATGGCVVLSQSVCTTLGITYRGDASTCTAANCAPGTGGGCQADFNHNGGLEVADIFAFLNAWFAGCP